MGVAFAANQLGFYVLMPMLSGGAHDGFTTIAIVVGIVVLIMVHFINLLLGILSPFMHPLRLHYVEMFTKFYSAHGGGVEYRPSDVSEGSGETERLGLVNGRKRKWQ